MYGMTAAHKTLPLPTYARVTNLRNGKSIVVRINDRGPFVANRLIDLSYTAAAKLDMLREGTTLVEVRALTPGVPDELARSAASPPPALYVQAGAFADVQNAQRALDKLHGAGLASAFLVPPVAGPLAPVPRAAGAGRQRRRVRPAGRTPCEPGHAGRAPGHRVSPMRLRAPLALCAWVKISCCDT